MSRQFLIMILLGAGTTSVEAGWLTFIARIPSAVKNGLAALVNWVMPPQPIEKTTKFYLVTPKYEHGRTEFDIQYLSIFDDCKGMDIYLIIHGWWPNVDWFQDMSKALLNYNQKSCVVQIDWQTTNPKPYVMSILDREQVGTLIFKFLSKLRRGFEIEGPQISFFALGLGAQIAGYAARMYLNVTGEKVGRIVALDPVESSLMSGTNDRTYLSKDDADHVHVLHTTAGVIGTENLIGNVDFFANGGVNQPGCKEARLSLALEPSAGALCGMRRSVEYMIEALENPLGFLGYKCQNWVAFQSEKCNVWAPPVSLADIGTNATGQYFFETEPEAPFAFTGKHRTTTEDDDNDSEEVNYPDDDKSEEGFSIVDSSIEEGTTPEAEEKDEPEEKDDPNASGSEEIEARMFPESTTQGCETQQKKNIE